VVPTFALGMYPVTFAEWEACVVAGGCNGYRPGANGWPRGRRPVINVSWNDAHAYAQWLSRKTGTRYRLPSEAEWEYAARAGTIAARYWGETIGSGHADCDACGSQWDNKQTAPVGSFKPNPWGLYDMLGNVKEWVEDCWNDDYRAAPSDGSAWLSGDCEKRVLRGGSWNNDPRDIRAAYRNVTVPELRYEQVGFRVASTLAP